MAEPNPTRHVEHHRVALLLERILLQLHQPLGSREYGDKSRDEFGQVASRALDAADQLEIGCHPTEGQRVAAHPQCGPGEGHEIAEGKTEVEHQVGEERKLRAAYNVMVQLALCVFQAVDGRVVAFECLEEHAVLDSLLQHALHF